LEAERIIIMRKGSCILVLALTSLWAGAVWAGGPLSRPEAMKLLAEGRWINTDGAMQPDGSYLAKQIMIYSPSDSMNIGELAITGNVANLDRAHSTLTMLTYRVTFDAKTTLKDENKRIIPSSKIQNGMGAKVQGKLLPNGVFHATKIRLQRGKSKAGDLMFKQRLFGPVTVVDPIKGILKVLNTTIKLRDDAQMSEHPPGTKPE
jgi:cytochrome c-type biogenesis protein CcmE